jgi:hypothetical protein
LDRPEIRPCPPSRLDHDTSDWKLHHRGRRARRFAGISDCAR